MKEIVVISGKGGAGKTSISAALAAMHPKEVLACDCDVDAANMHILMGADFNEAQAFQSGHEAVIDPSVCRGCGRCLEVCRFGAISKGEGHAFVVDPLACEGCHYCATICRPKAIGMEPRVTGESFCSSTRFGGYLVHATLGIGGENSGKLVAHVKERARKKAKETGAQFLLSDASPGIGCPVVSSLSGASLAVVVMESSASGLHDGVRVITLARQFGIPCAAIINKWDLSPKSTETIEAYLEKEAIPLVGKLRYQKAFWEALREKKTLYEHPKLTKQMQALWQNICVYM